MRLERININADCVFDMFGEYCGDGDINNLTEECNDIFHKLEAHFVNVICSGSEECSWTLMNAIKYRVLGDKPVTIDTLVKLMNKAERNQDTDEDYINYISVILSLYENINDDKLIPNCPYNISQNVIYSMINRISELTTTYAPYTSTIVRETISEFVNTDVLGIDYVIDILYDYYDTSNPSDDINCARTSLAGMSFIKAFVYIDKLCQSTIYSQMDFVKGIVRL